MENRAPRASADVGKCQYFKAPSAVCALSSDVWRRQSFVEAQSRLSWKQEAHKESVDALRGLSRLGEPVPILDASLITGCS